MSLSPARLHALHSIDQRDLPGWHANALPRLRAMTLSDARDVDLSERIIVGVVKSQLALRAVIAELSGRPIDRVDVAAQKILAVGLEQMRSLDRVPVHAIVDDAVEQTKRIGPRGASGFVNAILRKAAATRGRPPMPAPASPGARAEVEFSFPAGVFERLAKRYGSDRAVALCDGFNREPPLLARLLGDATIDALRARGVDATPHEAASIVVLAAARRDQLRELARDGLCQVQDATSAETVSSLDVSAGHWVLDRCAGRGTKTRQILERVGDAGRVVAMDTSLDRLASLRETLARDIAGGRLRVLHAATLASVGDDSTFDRVLVDAPCSNSGVFARRAESRYRQSPREIREVVALQREILDDTTAHVAAGGLLVYATCSIWPEENEAVVERFLQTHAAFELVEQRSVAPAPTPAPTTYRDGGFVATLRRK